MDRWKEKAYGADGGGDCMRMKLRRLFYVEVGDYLVKLVLVVRGMAPRTDVGL